MQRAVCKYYVVININFNNDNNCLKIQKIFSSQQMQKLKKKHTNKNKKEKEPEGQS